MSLPPLNTKLSQAIDLSIKQSLSLQTLPPDIQLIIYEHLTVLYDPTGIFTTRQYTSILRTSRLLRRETLSIWRQHTSKVLDEIELQLPDLRIATELQQIENEVCAAYRRRGVAGQTRTPTGEGPWWAELGRLSSRCFRLRMLLKNMDVSDN